MVVQKGEAKRGIKSTPSCDTVKCQVIMCDVIKRRDKLQSHVKDHVHFDPNDGIIKICITE